MEPTGKNRAEQSARTPGGAGDSGRLRTDAAATAEELRQFITRMHGKNPQEVLGAIAQSGLTRGIVTSAIGAIVLLVVFTVGPFLVNKLAADSTPPPRATPQQSAAQTKTGQAPTAGSEQAGGPQLVPEEADLQKATNAMGIGDAKSADPNKNPLDNKLDSLLDGVE